MNILTGKDVERILTLADTAANGEIDLVDGDTRIVVRLGRAQPSKAPAPPAANTAVALDKAMSAASPAAVAVDKSKTTDIAQGTPVASPLVGTFYRAPRPGAPPFVKPGDRVELDTVIGIVELMKLMNSVPAGIAGEVVEITAGDGTVVQTGDVLMIVRPV